MNDLREIISNSTVLEVIAKKYIFGNEIIPELTSKIIEGGRAVEPFYVTLSLPNNLPEADKKYHFKMPFSRAFRNFNLVWKHASEELNIRHYISRQEAMGTDNESIGFEQWVKARLEVREQLYNLMDEYAKDRKIIEQEIKDRESEL